MSSITYLRDEGILSKQNANDAVIWRDKIRSSCMYPNIAVCGKFISVVNGQGGVSPLGVTTENEARDAVRMQVNEGLYSWDFSLR